jgi:PAS domain S-box-containing protein
MDYEQQQDQAIRILYVEDEEVDRIAFEGMVRRESLNYQCCFARSVKETRELLSKHDFDVVIADYMLEDGTALDILKLTSDIPVIFCTGSGDQETAVKAMKQGAYDYLIKDTAQTHLKVIPEVVKKVVNHRQAEKKLKDYYGNLEKIVKQRTEELESEKLLLSKTLSGMSDGVIAVNTESEIILINRAAEELLGLCRQEVLHKKLHNFITFEKENNYDEMKCPLEQVLNSSGDKSIRCEKFIVKTTNKRMLTSATVSGMYKADGGLMGVVMVFRDISKEQELEKMKADFISTVSHELKTPVTSIKAYADIMLSESDLSGQSARKFLSIIVEQSNRLAQLIDRILEISKISTLDFNISTEPVNMCSLIEHISAELQVIAHEKGVEFETEIDRNVPVIKSDESRLHSVVTNLVNNAVKFTNPKGKVKLSLTKSEDNSVIEVSDTGIGIPKEDLIKIFDRFYRSRNSKNFTQGSGLGLAIVKETVDLLGGRIAVKSTPGLGTTFKIYMPLEPEFQKLRSPEAEQAVRDNSESAYSKKFSNN